MLRPILVTLFLCCSSVAVSAQEPHRVDVFAGYSALRIPSGTYLHGGQVAVTARVWKSLWIETAYSSHGGTAEDDGALGQFPPLLGDDSITIKVGYSDDIRDHLLVSGPRVAQSAGRVTGFGHALFGFARSSESAAVTVACDQGLCEPYVVNREYTATSLALVLGGGVDIRLTDRVSLRAVQADYVMTQLGTSNMPPTQNNLRLSAGLVFRFK